MPSPNSLDANSARGIDLGASLRLSPNVTDGSADYVFTPADVGRVVERTRGTAQTATVPADIFPIGAILTVEQSGAGALTIVAGSGVTLNTLGSLVSAGQYAVIQARQSAVNVWTVFGGLAAA
jgi:hypothetical protein